MNEHRKETAWLLTRSTDPKVEIRRAKIMERLSEHGRVTVNELSEVMGVTKVTIRMDLSDLEAQGALKRIHGGAVPAAPAYFGLSLQERMKIHTAQKKAIAQVAARWINDGDTIIMNCGTTTLFAAQALRNRRKLTLLTNSLAIAMDTNGSRTTDVILLGGNLNAAYQFTYGEEAIAQLGKYKADTLFLAVDGLSVEAGVTIYHHFEAALNRAMMAHAHRTVVLADASKIGRIGFAHIESADHISDLVTDERVDMEHVKKLEQIGVRIHIV